MRFEEVHRAFGIRPFHRLLVRIVSGYEYRVTTPETLISPRFATFLLKDGTHAPIAIEYIEEVRPLPTIRGRRARNGRRR